MIVGLLVFAVGLWWLMRRRQRVWQPRGDFPQSALPPPPRIFRAQADGCWYEATATLWFSQQGPLRRQGDGTLRCLGDQLIWLGHTGTITVPWESVLAVHGQPNGVLIHAQGIPPLVVSVADNAAWHQRLAVWMAHAWVWDGQQWISE
jgi:hypothetical protein